MNGLYVAMAALLCLFLGIGVAISAFAFWYLLKTIKTMTAAVQELTGMGSDLLGQGSFKKISSAMITIAEHLPEMLGAFGEFSKVMKVFHKAAFVEPEPVAGAGVDETSKFYPYSEAEAAENERTARSKRETLILTKEQKAGMRTDEESRVAISDE